MHLCKLNLLALFDLKRYEEAMKCFYISLTINPKSSTTHNSKGILLARIKEYERAIQMFSTKQLQ